MVHKFWLANPFWLPNERFQFSDKKKTREHALASALQELIIGFGLSISQTRHSSALFKCTLRASHDSKAIFINKEIMSIKWGSYLKPCCNVHFRIFFNREVFYFEANFGLSIFTQFTFFFWLMKTTPVSCKRWTLQAFNWSALTMGFSTILL